MDTDALFKLTVLTSYYFIAVLYFFYYIDTSVSLENIPLVKFIKNCIRDRSGLFSIISHVSLSMT